MQAHFVNRARFTLRLALALAIVLTVAVPAASTHVYAAPNAAPAASLRLTITPENSPIDAGETAYFRIELENLTDGNLPNLEMRLPVTGPVDGVRARVESKTDVPQSRMAVRDAGVIWRGGMQANGIITILIGVKSDATSDGGTIAINGEAGPRDDDADVTTSATVRSMRCARSI